MVMEQFGLIIWEIMNNYLLLNIGSIAILKGEEMEENIIGINKYMYFDKSCGRFCLTSEASEIIYRQKEIICSYSGADEWVNSFTLEMINLYTGSSPYNYALGTCDHHEAFPRIFKENPEGLCGWVEKSLTKEWGIHMYKMIENIIDDVPACE